MRDTITFVIDQERLFKALPGSTQGNGKLKLTLYVEDLVVSGDGNRITPDDYERFAELIKDFEINLKDIREIILLAHSFWEARRTDPWAEDRLVIKYHSIHKDDPGVRDKAYSEELLMTLLGVLGKCSNPVSDFYSRIKKTNPREYQTFEEFFKKLYETEE